MKIQVLKAALADIRAFRMLYATENNHQIRYHAVHERGWSDCYQLKIDERVVGYGATKGKDNHAQRDDVFEFYLVPPYRKMAPLIFRELLSATGAGFVECQSNDELLTLMLYEFAEEIQSGVILFADHAVTAYSCESAVFRMKSDTDLLFEHRSEPPGDYVLEFQGQIVASGGFMLHYNLPFADLYMEVEERFWQRGFGSFLIQELKKQCYLSGRVPAARCNRVNHASAATLLKAGMAISGSMLEGRVRQPIIL